MAELASTTIYGDLKVTGESNVMPSGGIIMWSGSTDDIPTTWALCDGLNGTPDLRDRFVVGAGSSYSVGATGGANSVALTIAQLPAHAHSFSGSSSSAGYHSHSGSTNSTGTHTHSYSDSYLAYVEIGNIYDLQSRGRDGRKVNNNTTGSAGAHSHSVTINSAGAHTHTISGTIGSTGSGQAHENRPPFYALAYIMKL